PRPSSTCSADPLSPPARLSADPPSGRPALPADPPSRLTRPPPERLNAAGPRRASPERKPTPVTSAPPVPYSRPVWVDHEDRPAAGRRETGDSLRQNAVDPGFHGVPVAPAHPGRDADGVDVS